MKNCYIYCRHTFVYYNRTYNKSKSRAKYGLISSNNHKDSYRHREAKTNGTEMLLDSSTESQIQTRKSKKSHDMDSYKINSEDKDPPVTSLVPTSNNKRFDIATKSKWESPPSTRNNTPVQIISQEERRSKISKFHLRM